jgi:ferrous iron transport protein B
MELPPYRIPTTKSILKHMWFRAEQYLRKIAGIILVASIIIWALGYFPRNSGIAQRHMASIAGIERSYNARLAGLEKDSPAYLAATAQRDSLLTVMQGAYMSEMQENSYIGRIGKFFEPAMQPLGFDWKMSIGILTGIAAKEIVVGTLGVLYHAEPDEDNSSLTSKIQTQKYTSGPRKGQNVFNPLVAISFMLFVLIYFPCIGVIATIKKESGSWKWALFTVFYTTGLAWIIAFMVYQAGLILT